MWSTDGYVYAMALHGDTLYIGGGFNWVAPATGCFVPLSTTTGALVSPFPKVVGEVFATAPDGSGGWYIGGDFSRVGDLPRLNLAHILADGSVSDWSPNPNAWVWALSVSGGTVYAGGYFSEIGGQPRAGIAAFDGTTGSLTPWDPGGPGCEVYALAVAGNTIYVGGYFFTIGGQPRNHIAAVDAASGTATAWNPGADNPVFTLALSGSTVYAGGMFMTMGGQPRNYIAAIDAVSGAVTSWDPSAEDPYSTYATVHALAVNGGLVYAGGNFTRIGGQARNHIAALDPESGVATPWNPDADDDVLAIAFGPGTVYAGGGFYRIGGQARRGAAALDAGTGSAKSWDPGLTQAAYALAVSGSTIHVGGVFHCAGGQVRHGLAALDVRTGRPIAWNPHPSGAVLALALAGGIVYIGGDFTDVGGQMRNHIAALDAVTGAVTPWNPNATGGGVATLTPAGGVIYAGGDFTAIGGQSRNRIAALDARTGAATSWDPNPAVMYPPGVRSIAVSDRTVYVAGSFTSIGGQTRNNIAAIDATSGAATPWDPAIPAGSSGVNALALSGHVIYVGGDFSEIGGQARNYLAALDTATGAATAWNPDVAGDLGFPDYIRALAVSGSVVYAAGELTRVGSQTRNYLAAIDTATGLATPWNPDPDNGVHCLALSRGTVYAGGRFATVSGELHGGFVRMSGSPGAYIWTIYPGDANDDGVVDVTDVLPLGRFWGLTGAPRPGGSLDWTGQPLPEEWSNEMACYADCNGDGVVDAADVQGIVQNWSATRTGGRPPEIAMGEIRTALLGAIERMSPGPIRDALRSAVLSATQGAPAIAFRIEPNVPNPFAGSTTFRFTLPEPVPRGSLEVFDLSGRLVRALALHDLRAGANEVTWDGRSDAGPPVGPGLYFYRLSAGPHAGGGRVLVLR